MIIDIPKKIEGIRFSLLSPKEIRAMAATKIITPDTYGEDGFPIEMGLMDAKMGIISPGLRCKTCGRGTHDCPGHFGYIDLAMPVIHVGFGKEIKDLLSATCRACGRILLAQPEQYKGRSVKEVLEATKGAEVCPHCGERQGKVKLDKPTTIREEGQRLSPVAVRERLERIPNKDLPLLGIDPTAARPEWMVLTVLPVPPVPCRPSITLETGERSEDDLTHKMVDILRINKRLRENRDAGAPQLIIEDLWDLLQYHVTTYFDNQSSGIPPARHRSGRPLRTIAQRLKGKEGRFRSNLSGKRVDFSTRTVISPDPTISINEVGVPQAAAEILTVPVATNASNLERMKKMVRHGPTYPGVKYIIRVDGRRVKITEKNASDAADRMEAGCVVERQLVDGDIVLFNRQPSLHRMSMMAHEVRVMSGRTFRLNLAVCPPYNADFDGDEMNLHVVQGEEARVEARALMRVQEHILSPRFGGPVIGAIHDQVSGIYLLTRKSTDLDKGKASQLLSSIGYRGPMPRAKNGRWTGKQIISLLLPSDLSMTFKASICEHCPQCKEEGCDNDAYVVIKNGKLLHGTIDEAAISPFKGALIGRIVLEYGSDRGREFINRVTRLGIAAIRVMGFTTGIDDNDLPAEAAGQIAETIATAHEKVTDLVRAYHADELEALPGRSLAETLEMEVMKVLSRTRDRTGQIADRHLGLNNESVIMARSGARGSLLNLTQMTACVGQQAVRGERISRGYHGRTLSHFERGDLGADAKGFATSSYKKGLTPTEFFFHCMGGRESLVDTAVRTSRSGYMQRRLTNALVDIDVGYDGAVRDSTGAIIQMVYGEDGTDPSESVYGKSVDVKQIVQDVVR